MSDPFSGIPDPEMPRPIRRRFQPGPVQEALQAMRETLRSALPATQKALWQARWAAKESLRRAHRLSNEGLRLAKRHGQDLWLRGKRHPRTTGIIAGSIALTLAGAYALSASGAGSLCPPASDGKAPQFLLLMHRMPQAAAGSKVEIQYDVCGLSSGEAYRGRVRLIKQGKKGSAKPKPLVVSFKDEVDGVATRRHQELDLGRTKPGSYTLELAVADSQGRERRRVQKVVITGQ